MPDASAREHAVVRIQRQDGTLQVRFGSVDVKARGRRQVAFAGVLDEHPSTGAYLSESPAAKVLKAYERWGESVFERLRGSFVVVIADGDDGKVLVARDPTGISPAFWACAGDDLLVSTSAGRLVDEPHVSKVIDRGTLAAHLAHAWPDPTRTFFEGVRRLLPGHVLELSDAGVQARRHWDPAPLGAGLDWIPEADAQSSFQAALDTAVDRALGRGRAGIWLSGGLDSVTVASVATERASAHAEDTPLALSLVFPDPGCNEEPVQRAVAASLGLPHVVATWDEAVGADGLIARSLDLSSSSDGPLANYWLPAYEHLGRQATARGARTIFTGGGGDEWLTVTPFYAADLIRTGDLRGLVQLFRDQHLTHAVRSLPYARNLAWGFGLRPILVDLVPRAVKQELRRARIALPEWVAPDRELREQVRFDVLRAAERRDVERSQIREGGHLPSTYLFEMRVALSHALTSIEMEETFEVGRRCGASVRQPFWDPEVVALLYRTPPDVLNGRGYSKGLVRQTVARRFPGLGFEHQRKVSATGFSRKLLRSEGLAAWRRLGGADALSELEVVDGARVDASIAAVEAGKRGSAIHLIWDMLSAEVWVRSQLEKGAAWL
jgi:asparagine synthase (glutamine-hydrolysing)